ncbi:hypothetical protein NQ314_013801, partial [Rhamnusium bicolor]
VPVEMEGTSEFSEIQHFYANTTVFVTGATGFVGKLVLEKILRQCDVKHVYLLVRGKDGVDAEARCANIFDSTAFLNLKRNNQEFYKKVSLLLGDCEQPDLGLSDYDKSLIIKEVNCIFHCAALTRYDEPLKKSRIGKRKSYSGSSRNSQTSRTFKRDNISNSVESSLLGDWPNTYTFTKQIAEDLIKREGRDLSISIVRASHIIPAADEPITGYVENIYSLSGLAVANALGINRVNYYKNGILDVVPVDYVVSLLLASGWYAGLQKLRKKRGDITSTDVLVYHCVTSQEKSLTSDEWMGITETACREVPTTKMIQLPLTFNTSCYYNYKLLTFLLHTCMGFLCDIGLRIAGKKTRTAEKHLWIVDGYKRLHKIQELGSPFFLKQWYISNENTQKLLKRMSFRDRELFNFDILNINWETYFHSFARGLRVYILNDPMSTLSEGRKKQQRKLVTQLLSAVFFVLLFYVIIKFVLFRAILR